MEHAQQLSALTANITQTSLFFLGKAQSQVNVAMTVRNWLIGYHIVEFEQAGKLRAGYGDKLLLQIAEQLKGTMLKGLGYTNLKVFRQFYKTYPEIQSGLSLYLKPAEYQSIGIGQMASDQFHTTAGQRQEQPSIVEAINTLSFSHFLELTRLDTIQQRNYYQTEAIRRAWSVADLKRAIGSLQFERTGLNPRFQEPEVPKRLPAMQPGEIFKSPYILEFLQLAERPIYSESDLENSIINHLQQFLLELGNGFCFEARQKRLTFGNTHYYIDLVFYHRILKCNVLLELKIGEFDHGDAGQMNMYINYYRENEMAEGDNPPIGIILCAGKDNDLVRYATQGLAHNVFVSKYLVNLPSEKQLQDIIASEKAKTTPS